MWHMRHSPARGLYAGGFTQCCLMYDIRVLDIWDNRGLYFVPNVIASTERASELVLLAHNFGQHESKEAPAPTQMMWPTLLWTDLTQAATTKSTKQQWKVFHSKCEVEPETMLVTPLDDSSFNKIIFLICPFEWLFYFIKKSIYEECYFRPSERYSSAYNNV